MNKKQSLYFNIVFPIYISIVLGFIMTSVFAGFNQAFWGEYAKSIIIGIVMTTPPGFLVVNSIAKATFKSNPHTRGEHALFHFYLALLMTGLVTVATSILNVGLSAPIAFIMAWVKSWAIALIFAFVIIHFSLPPMEKIIMERVRGEENEAA